MQKLKQIRVLHVYRTYFPDPPGGLQEAIRQICLNTISHKIMHTIFCLSPQPNPKKLFLPEAKIVRCRSWLAPRSCDLGDWRAITCFSSLMKNSDVLHFHYPWPFADLMNFLIGSKKPSILTYHSDIIRQRFLGTLYKPFLFLNLRRMHAVVATSPDYVQSSPVLSQASIRNKVRVIPLGVNDSTCNTSPDHSVTQRIGIKNREPYFLFIGVLRYYKGLDNLIRAALMVPAKVVIAGSGPERNRLIKLASKLRARNVIFSGQVTEAEKVALLQNSHAFVLPSHLRSEAFGMALIEAAKFGRPLISCDIGTGTSFVNQQEETGFVVPPQSPSKLAEALNLLLANIELGRRMGMAARKRYELLFSGEALGKAYAALYQEVASCK